MSKRDYDNGPAELPLLRAEIEQTDRQIIKLFHQRMELAASVARHKIASGRPVYDERREEELVRNAVNQSDSNQKMRIETLLRSLMRLSRGVQYELILDADNQSPRELEECGSADLTDEKLRIVCQGTAGAYSLLASRLLFPGLACEKTRTFGDACGRVSDKLADVAVLPLENSTAGTVNDVYDLLLSHRLYIWRSISLPVRHHLLAIPEARLNDIHTVISHPQALAQCSALIREYGWQARESLNTAFAAETVAVSKDAGIAAIASDAAAEEFSLQKLLSNINDASANQTRFIAAGRELVVTPDANRVSLILRLPHQSGALASTLAVFSDRRLNLTKIQSRPDPELPWNYLFYLDFEAGLDDLPAVRATLYHLEQEMPYCRLLGWYHEQKGEDTK